MLFVVLRAGARRFALDSSHVEEVVPLVRFTPLPGAPPFLLGLFRWRGAVTAAVDLSLLAGGEPAPGRMSTRILVSRCRGRDGGVRFVGLVAEGVTGNLLRPADGEPSPVAVPDAPWISGVLADGDEMVPCLDLAGLLPPEVLDVVQAQGPGEAA